MLKFCYHECVFTYPHPSLLLGATIIFILMSLILSPNWGDPLVGEPVSVIICQLNPSVFLLEEYKNVNNFIINEFDKRVYCWTNLPSELIKTNKVKVKVCLIITFLLGYFLSHNFRGREITWAFLPFFFFLPFY